MGLAFLIPGSDLDLREILMLESTQVAVISRIFVDLIDSFGVKLELFLIHPHRVSSIC